MTIRDRLIKARLEVNNLKNTAARSLYAVDRAIDECGCDEGAHDPDPVEPAPTPEPTPEPVAPTAPITFSPAYDYSDEKWQAVTSGAVAPSKVTQNEDEGREDTSAWRLKLKPSGILRYDDPVLFPGQPGAAHLHHGLSVEFDAFTTHDTLMNQHSNLRIEGGPLYQSNLFMPAMIDYGRNEVVNVDGGSIYYKTYPSGHPRIGGHEAQNIPAGLQYVAKGGNFTLREPFDQGRNSRAHTGHAPTLAAMIKEWDDKTGSAPIPSGWIVAGGYDSPHWWNGKDLFLPDSAHLSAQYKPSHPIRLPTPQILPNWMTLREDEVRDWRLASDVEGQPAGHSAHWDYQEAINERVRQGMQEIFEGHFSANNGPIGFTGRALQYAKGDGSPWRMPIPPAPNAHAGHIN